MMDEEGPETGPLANREEASTTGVEHPWQSPDPFDDKPAYDIDFDKLHKMCINKFGNLTPVCYEQWELYMNTISDPQCQNLKKYALLSTHLQQAWNFISRINNCHESCQLEKYKELHDGLIREIIKGMLEIDAKEIKPLQYPYEIGPHFHLKDPYINVGALMFVASTLWMKKQEIQWEPTRLQAPIDCTDEIQQWSLFYSVMCNVDIGSSFVHATFVKLWKSAMKKPKKKGYYCTHDVAIQQFLGKLQEHVRRPRKVDAKTVLEKYAKKLESLILLNAKDQDLVQGTAMDLKLKYPADNENSRGPIHAALFAYWNAEFDYQFEDMLHKANSLRVLNFY